MRMTTSIFTLLVFAATAAYAEDAYTVKFEKAEPPKELAAGISAVLSDQALVVQSDKGATVATIWVRKALPSKAVPEQVKSGLTYREIQQGTLVGAIQFPQVWNDYRNQRIAAGVYTLRMALQPENGDHQGTAPYNDFCLLSPAAKDTKPDTMDVKELHELSSFAPGGSHPGVLLLFPNTKPTNAAKIESKPMGIQVLYTKLSVEAGSEKTTLGFGFVVAGHAKE